MHTESSKETNSPHSIAGSIASCYFAREFQPAMVRKYNPKGTKCKFSDEALQSALRDLKENKGSIRSTAKAYGIPFTTLRAHFVGISKKRFGGRPTVLTDDEEREMVLCCQVLQEMGFPIDRRSLQSVVTDYLKGHSRKNPFPDDIPGPDWFRGFMKRWKTHLSQRKPQHLSRKRAKALTEDRVEKWMEFVEEVYRKQGLVPLTRKELSLRLWNCDETAFATASSCKLVIAKRGARSVYETMAGSGREYITVHWCGNACGDQTPPYILYKAKHLYTAWTTNGPMNAMYGVSDSGWMEKPNFYSWFVKGFIPQLRKLKILPPIQAEPSSDLLAPSENEDEKETPGAVLFFDGHYSHINLDVIRVARKNNVTLISLPPNTTHALQPLDVGIFGPMKKEWQKILSHHRQVTHGRGIDKIIFPKLIRLLQGQSMKRSHFTSAFRAAGLYPQPTASAIPRSLLAPAEAVTAVTAFTKSPKPRSPSKSKVTTSAVKLQLRHHFASLFKLSATPKPKSKPNPSSRVALSYYGEVLTTEEAFSRLQQQEIVKAAKSKKGKKPQTAHKRAVQHRQEDVNTCQECKKQSSEDSEDGQDTWVGCDQCWRWFHSNCVGLGDLLDENEPWVCHICS